MFSLHYLFLTMKKLNDRKCNEIWFDKNYVKTKTVRMYVNFKSIQNEFSSNLISILSFNHIINE